MLVRFRKRLDMTVLILLFAGVLQCCALFGVQMDADTCFAYALGAWQTPPPAETTAAETEEAAPPSVPIAETTIGRETAEIHNETSYEVDTAALLEDYKPPAKKAEPQILIVHTHATEGYADSISNRTEDNQRNVVRVGEELQNALEAHGFAVLHDTTQHDNPNYNGSYQNCLKTVERYLRAYPSLEIVLDIHRDGLVKEDGTKLKVAAQIDGVKTAQMMLVVGTDEGGLSHDNWQSNLKFALGLQKVLDTTYPGLMRPLDLRKERFNGHTTQCSIIVEVGSNGNELSEALHAVHLLADAMAVYIQ